MHEKIARESLCVFGGGGGGGGQGGGGGMYRCFSINDSIKIKKKKKKRIGGDRVEKLWWYNPSRRRFDL